MVAAEMDDAIVHKMVGMFDVIGMKPLGFSAYC
jgi:hypothetical protein